MVFGGGGAEGEFNNGLIDCAAAVLLFVLIGSHWTGRRPLPDVSVFAVGLILALQLIILLQLVPLPYAVWSALSGRALPAAALDLASTGNQMRPLSLDPEATRRFCTALFLPAAIVLGMLGAAKRDLRLFLWAAVAAGAVSGLIGSLQLALGAPEWLSFYGGVSRGMAPGVFANTNHQAAFLCGALFALALLLRLEDGQLDLRPFGLKGRLHVGWVLVPIFAIMTIATGSRAGTAVLPGVLVAALIIAVRMRSAVKTAAVGVLVCLLVGLAILFYPSDNSLALREDFLFGQDIRYAYLPDIQYTLREYWPYGSGFGTFRTVFQHNETLDIATAGVLNHAHNDVLEWLIEGGAAGAAWLLALALGSAVLLYKALGHRREQGRSTSTHLAIAGLLMVVTLGLMSLVDYPTRTRAVLAVCSLGFGLLISAGKPPTLQRQDGSQRAWLPVGLAVLGLAVGLQSLRIRAAQAAVWAGDGRTAAAIRPQSGQALSLSAERHLLSHDVDGARALAVRALQRSPLDARAVRTIAITSDPRGPVSSRAWIIAANMGWRDPPTQLWAMRQAFRNGEFATSALRADALLRTGREAGRLFLGEVRAYAQKDAFRRELLGRLKLNPSWRASFFRLAADTPDDQLRAVIATLKDLASSAEKPSSAETRSAIAGLIKRGHFQEAQSLYRLTADSSATAAMLSDGSFERSTDDYKMDTTPFDWTITNLPGANASIEPTGQRTLLISTDGEAKGAVVQRYIALAPGKYVLAYQVRGDREAPEGTAVQVSCDGSNAVLGRSSPAPLNGNGFETRTIQIAVPRECPLVLVAFQALPYGTPTTVEFDNVQVRRLH
jgi:O-antigen ligase